MSSWKKAAKSNQKTHRERRQPESRQHLGLLEKKKDYKLRALDRAEKEETLKLLRKKALNKNPDEFYHHMINSKIKDDEHVEKIKVEEHTEEQKKLMQTQDYKYITMKRVIEKNKIKRLQSQLHFIDKANETQNQHTFFVDSEEDLKNFDVVKRLKTDAKSLAKRTNRRKVEDSEEVEEDQKDDPLKTEREKSYKELSKRIEREKQLAIVQRKLELKRIFRQKTKLQPKLITRGSKESAPVYEFKFERKR